jgi:hypothetical protein
MDEKTEDEIVEEGGKSLRDILDEMTLAADESKVPPKSSSDTFQC